MQSRTTTLGKVSRARLSDQAAGQLKRRIALGVLPPGARLPTEAELAGELGVTRLTVREALAQLEASGFTTTRHGSGTFVADVDGEATFRVLSDLLAAGRDLSPEQALDLMEFRAIVIGGFAAPLAARSTPGHIAALRAILEEAAGEKGKPEALAALDFRFNELLAAASGNSFYALLVRSLREVHLHLGAVIFRERRDDDAILGAMERIVAAIEAKKRAGLARALETYLAGGTELVRHWIRRGAARAPARKKRQS
jgi:GntR family transcriptional repressor for pyruvate dehydrogenase complex